MKSYGSAFVLVPLLTLLLFSTPTALGSSRQSPEGPAVGTSPLIDIRDNHLTVMLHRVPWGVVLQELQGQSGLTIRLQGRLDGTVTEAFEALPLEKGLRRLFRDADLIFLYTAAKQGHRSNSRLVKVWILPRGGGGPAATVQSPQRPARAAAAEDPLGPLIKSALTAAQEEEREWAVEALAEYQDPRIKEALIQALQDSHADVRESAVEALAELKDETAVDHLGQALVEDASEDVRASAADALGEIASPRAIDALQRALQDTSVEVRENVVEALGQIGGDQAIAALQRALRDEDEDVREAATAALRQLTGKRAGK